VAQKVAFQHRCGLKGHFYSKCDDSIEKVLSLIFDGII